MTLIPKKKRTQCRNFTIFLSFKFYVKSITYGDSKSAKSAILTLIEEVDFDFYEFLHFCKTEILSLQNGKWAVLELKDTSKIDFT